MQKQSGFYGPRSQKSLAPPLISYKWKRVPFGLSPSPFLLRFTINKHFKSLKTRFPETIEQLEKNLYVDDYLGGANDLPVAKQRVEESNVTSFRIAKLSFSRASRRSREKREFSIEERSTGRTPWSH